MNAVQALRESADLAFEDLMASIKDLDETRAWASVKPLESEYLNTAGSIVAIVQHVASCKFCYLGGAFTDGSVRGRDVFARTKEIAADWDKTQQFLLEGQASWMASWAAFTPEHLDKEFLHFSGKPWPAWKIIATMIGHDHYHAGQINLIRSVAPPSPAPPDMQFDEEEKFARETRCW